MKNVTMSMTIDFENCHGFMLQAHRTKRVQLVIGGVQQFPAVELHDVAAPGGQQMQALEGEVVETDVLVVGARGFALRRRLLVGMLGEFRDEARVMFPDTERVENRGWKSKHLDQKLLPL